MAGTKQRLQNIFGLLLKLTISPLVFQLLSYLDILQPDTFSISGVAWLLISAGLLGTLFSDLIMIRYGDGRLQAFANAQRLVDVGLYARNRHPSFWFFSIYQLGILLLFLGFNNLTFIIWLGLFVICILFLIFIQEKRLIRSLGARYIKYKESIPFIFWKIKIPENRRIKFLPQLVWLFGITVLRYWYKIKISGTEHIPHDRPFIVVANHESYLDPVLFSIFIPFEVQFVTTADVFTTPLMRFLLKGIGTFPMRRHRQDLKSIRTMLRLIKSGQIVGIFPEGGRSIDGSPLPILKETLKLIQHSKVPILPVHIDGAYEIWPRWAPNRRRGQVTATFNPIIPVADQADLSELEVHIQKSIFAENKTFIPVKSINIASGLDNFLWACHKCHTHNSIEVSSKNSISCRACSSSWQITDNYTLIDHDSAQSRTLITWIAELESSMLAHQEELPPGLKIPKQDRIYLSSKINKYMGEDGSELTGEIFLLLSDNNLFLIKDSVIIKTWPMKNVTIFTMDYHNAVSIGVGGIRHTFYLPETEIALKWQMYFDTLYARVSASTKDSTG